MEVRQYAPESAELELDHTAVGLEQTLWGVPYIETVLGVDDQETARSTQEAAPTDTHLSWTRVELHLEDGHTLTVQANIVPRLAYPRLPHEYRAWLA